jgi:voltage-gated sodium channel
LTGRAGALAPLAATQLKNFVESRGFTAAVMIVIAVNAVTLGLETWPPAMQAAGPLLLAIDRLALWFFTLEIGLKIWLYRGRFFRDPWSVFDFVIVAIAWVPTAGPLSVLRALRIVRALRLLSIVPQMRNVIGALFHALPGMGSVIAVLGLVFYVAAVMATQLFGTDFPDWFGSVGASMYSLFQIMTLESWSMGIVRPVMEQYPYAWLFFVPFIIVTSFAVLNLFIALIVNSMQSMQSETNENVRARALAAHDEREALSRQIEALTDEIRDVREALRRD